MRGKKSSQISSTSDWALIESFDVVADSMVSFGQPSTSNFFNLLHPLISSRHKLGKHADWRSLSDNIWCFSSLLSLAIICSNSSQFDISRTCSWSRLAIMLCVNNMSVYYSNTPSKKSNGSARGPSIYTSSQAQAGRTKLMFPNLLTPASKGTSLLDIIPSNFCALWNYYIILLNRSTNYQQEDINRQGKGSWEYKITFFSYLW